MALLVLKMIRIFYISICILFISCTDNRTEAVTYPIIEAMVLDKTIHAGDKLKVKIKQKNPQHGILLISNGFLSYEVPVTPLENQIITLGSSYTSASGLFSIEFIKHDRVLHKEQVLILPNKADGTMDILTGPRSINVDQTQQSMIVSIPHDSLGNPVQEGTTIDFSYQIGEDISRIQTQDVENLLAYEIVDANTQAQDAFVGISHQISSSRKQRIISTPSWPQDLSMSTESFYPYANNRNLFKVVTWELTDKYGNKLVDGTLLKFHVFENNIERAKYNGICIDGKAFCYIKNPSQKSNWLIKASIGDNYIGNDLVLAFENDLQELRFKFQNDELIVGPLLGQLGQYISEGSKVVFKVGDKEWHAETLNGIARFDLSSINWNKKDRAQLSCLGASVKVVYE